MSVCKNNVWGTVCDYSWDINDAAVVCRQLGFSIYGIAIYTIIIEECIEYYIILGSTALHNAYFGQGTGPTAHSYVYCTGSEARLIDCPSQRYSCSHSRDAGVRCLAQTGKQVSMGMKVKC